MELVSLARDTVSQHILSNRQGMRVTLLDFGATLVSVQVPVKQELREIVLGYDRLEDYKADNYYLGCTVGRFAGRIAQGQFRYRNQSYQLARNVNHRHHLHGGLQGFGKVVWQAALTHENKSQSVTFSYLSQAGEEQYPGNLAVDVTYTLTDDNELKIHYHAVTDAATPVNLTNHAYWNLSGAGSGDISEHELAVVADNYLVTDAEMIPTGEIASVVNTAYDFRQPKRMGFALHKINGYDVCYVVSPRQNQLRLAARVRELKSNLMLNVFTTQPAMQFYTGNFLTTQRIAQGKMMERFSGFCLETQNFPDAMNHAHFPSAMLMPGEVYTHETIYQVII
jgi:aldose 1-epimerase